MCKWWVLSFGLVIAGCSTTPTTITQNIYPNLPDVPNVPDLNLRPVHVEFPNEKSFVAFDFDNWANLQINLQILKQTVLEYKQRISEINKQRAEWRAQK